MNDAVLNRLELARYGLLGLPLAFVALPLYVLLPNHYARNFGVPLAALGGVLLLTRFVDALTDPWIGRWIDRLQERSRAAVLRLVGVGAIVLALGFAALFMPPVRAQHALLGWAAAMLAITYLGYSTVTVAHQAWGARLGGDKVQRSRITGTREALALVGVLVAAAAPTLLGLQGMAVLLASLLALAWFALASSRSPTPTAVPQALPPSALLPLRNRAFRSLLAVFVVNGVATAIPATLVLFFVQDRLQAPAKLQPAFLGVYFFCAALSVPGWLWLVRRVGLARSWLAGMALAIAGFVFALALRAGDHIAFLAICAASGAALGTDLALPSALLAGVIGEAGHRGRHEGAYFGWWNLAAKLSLALAAGLSLPALEWAGYAPGRQDDRALTALSIAYCLLPCALKLVAAACLQRFIATTPETA
jgi:glycoside/pentoside/hexuronide:cation symporter, GPH family